MAPQRAWVVAQRRALQLPRPALVADALACAAEGGTRRGCENATASPPCRSSPGRGNDPAGSEAMAGPRRDADADLRTFLAQVRRPRRSRGGTGSNGLIAWLTDC